MKSKQLCLYLVDQFKNISTGSITLSALTYVICLHGFSYNDGNDEISLAPIGLGGWLPSLKKRDGSESAWTTYIATSFYGVARNTCRVYACIVVDGARVVSIQSRRKRLFTKEY